MAAELQEKLREIGATQDVIDSFSGNGYSCLEDLKHITDHELKTVIPQMLIRKKFAKGLIPWLLEFEMDIEENLFKTAGIHHSQRKTVVSLSSTSSHAIDSADTDYIDVSFLESSMENIKKHVLLAKNIAHIENLVDENHNLHDIQTTPDERKHNPIWLLLSKGSAEAKRISELPENSKLTASKIKEIAKETANYLFSVADLPKRQDLPEKCTFWTKNNFEKLFPNTTSSRFYYIKREKYTTKDGKGVNKERATGVLHTQLSQLRRKLLIKDGNSKLRSSAPSSSPSSGHPANFEQPGIQEPQKISRDFHRLICSEKSNLPYTPPETDNEVLQAKLDNLRSEIPNFVSFELLKGLGSNTNIEKKNSVRLLETYGTSIPNIGPNTCVSRKHKLKIY